MKKYVFKKISYNSIGEYEIAKFLSEMNIDFEYEFPIAVIDGDRVKLWYPDFYLKEYQIVIEYFGMYNHNEAYKENAEHKKEVFKKCGIQFLPIYKLNKRWKEYTLKTILSHLEYKREKMQDNLNKLNKKNSKWESVTQLFKKKPTKPDRNTASK